MSGDPRIPDGSRAILIGVAHYQDATYRSYAAVGNSVDGMYQLLVESGLCGWRAEQVTKIPAPVVNAGQLMGRLRQWAAETTGVLLLYFVGHGQPSEHTGELCLAIADTDHANPDATGLEYTKIKMMLHSGTPAVTKIAILDCCYSGRAIGLGADDDGMQLADLSDCAGAYTLTSADERAHVPPNDEGNPRTAFTGELLDLLTSDGIPGGPPGLTLGTIFPRLRQRLEAKGLPRPNQRSDDAAAAFVFAHNVVPPAVPDDPAERLRAELAASERRYEARLDELHQSIVRLRQEGRAVDAANGQQRDLRQAVEQARRDRSEAATALLRNQELTRLRDALVILLRRPAALASARAHSLHTAESSAPRGSGEQQATSQDVDTAGPADDVVHDVIASSAGHAERAKNEEGAHRRRGSGRFVPLAAEDPREVGGYVLRARLGVGGVGRVYLSFTPGGRALAIKVVLPEHAEDEEFRRRFKHEVAAAQRVQGLYTAPVVDADATAPLPWLATAYVPGPSLRQAVADHGPLPIPTVFRLLEGVAEGLAAVHACGIIHRDLTPANVLLAEDGPRVIDFGIAHAAAATSLTRTGLRVGTPAFMAPEQVRGRSATAATDVFALGHLAVFAASGHPAFGEGNQDALFYRIRNDPPDLDDCPPELRPIVDRCLAKEPRERPDLSEVIGYAREQSQGQPTELARSWLPLSIANSLTTYNANAYRPGGTEHVTYPRQAEKTEPATKSDDSDPGAVTTTVRRMDARSSSGSVRPALIAGLIGVVLVLVSTLAVVLIR